MLGLRRSIWIAVVLGGFIGVTLMPPATASAAKPAQHLVISPRPGETVRSHLAWIRVREPDSRRLRIRLNGRRIDRAMHRFHGVRSLRASISHGLRRGLNRLTIRVLKEGRTVRKASVRFRVRTRNFMVGAGRDRQGSVGGALKLAGRLGGAHRQNVPTRWTLVGKPRTPRGIKAPPARLLNSNRLRPKLLARAPGRYTLRLTVGKGDRASSDRVTIAVVHPNKLVPISTMTSKDTGDADAGIRVGNSVYKMADATRVPANNIGYIQVVVLDRSTLGFISNRRYDDASSFDQDLNKLDTTRLVIFALQPNGGQTADPGELNDVLGKIGAPDYVKIPRRAGGVSVIGVPGLARGQADVNVLPYESGRLARMTGYLTPDQFDAYRFVPDRTVPFRFGPGPTGTCTSDCSTGIGFQLHVMDEQTLAPGPGDGQFFNTGGASGASEAGNMSHALETIPAGFVVTIEARSKRLSGQDTFQPPVAAIDKGNMVRLANAIARIGGTRNGFNRIARLNGATASGGMTYALVGWTGAREGEGAEVAANVFGAGPSPSLNGNLRPDRGSAMRPEQVTDSNLEGGPAAVLFDKPSNEWPLDDSPGAAKAFAYLGSTSNSLSSDPRTAYWAQPFGEAKWEALAAQIAAINYADVPPTVQKTFTEPQFILARKELNQELKWVANVRGYMANLANPFDTNILKGWTEAQAIADQIYKDANEPGDEATMWWLEYTAILLDLADPVTDDISGEIGSLLELGMSLSSSSSSGGPSEIELRFEASKLGQELTQEMQTASNSYRTMGDVIVSDPEKLKLVGSQGGCLPSDPACDKSFSFTQAERTRVTADITRSIKRFAFEKLLPLNYHVFKLNPDTSANLNGGLPRNPAEYGCGFYHPWSYYSSTALELATSSLLQQLDPSGAKMNGWQLLVMARPPGDTTVHGQPPSDELLEHIFSPSAPGNDPNAGGIGLLPDQLMSEQHWNYWSPNENTNPTGDSCYWDGG